MIYSLLGWKMEKVTALYLVRYVRADLNVHVNKTRIHYFHINIH
jgi:hypothetical protein